MADFAEFLAKAAAKAARECDCDDCKKMRGKKVAPVWSEEVQAQTLRDAYNQLGRRFEWRPGMLVTYKLGLESGYKHKPGEICIISRLIDPPLSYASDENTGTHFGRKLDIAVLSLQEDGSAVEHIVDSRFFEPFEVAA